MSFRELTMTNVKEVLRRWQAGQSARGIERDGVADRKTVARYVEAARQHDVDQHTELTDDVVRSVAIAVQQRPTVRRSEERSLLDTQRVRIEQWLRQSEPLRLTRVHELLLRDGIEVSYSTLLRYAHEEFGWKERPPTVRIDDPPAGEEAQIDFGKMGYITTVDGSHRHAVWVLIVTLTMSRYQFVWPTYKQTLEALCAGLDAAWWFFGGVVLRVVLDNMTAAIIKADPKDPTINPAFLEYAQSRGFFVDPARVRRPQDKARVENQVPYVRERWFAGETFADDDIVALRKHAMIWCRDVAGARLHGTTQRVPREVFEAEEKAHLLKAPEQPFDVPRWTTAKVHPDHHIQIARALYSVPTKYLHQRVRVRLDSRSIEVYFQHELVKKHTRVPAGKRATDPNDYPVGKAPYAQRSIDSILQRARQFGEHVGRYAERLLEGPLPWVKMRQAYGLLRLCERYSPERVDALCSRSLAFDVVDVRRIERMLKQAKLDEQSAPEGRVVPLPKSRFARDPKSFETVKKPAAKGGE